MQNQQSDNQRQSYRFPINDAQRNCVLRVGEKLVPGLLLDESVGGFGVLVGRQLDFSASPSVELRTADGWFVTEAARAVEVAPPEKILPFMAKEPGPWFELGLSRRGEVAVEQPAPPASKSPFRRWFYARMPSSGTLMVLGIVLVASLVVTPVGFSLIAWYTRCQRPEAGSRNAEWTAKGMSSPSPRWPPDRQNPHRRGNRSALGKSADKMPELPPTSLSNARRAEIRKMPGATPFISPDLVKDLQLTPAQQEKIRQIVDDTDGLVLQAQADGRLHDLPQEEIDRQRDQLLAASRHRAIRVLTKEQRLQWAEIIH
jgi:hypothetical protein